jgi:hypothetical protein
MATRKPKTETAAPQPEAAPVKPKRVAKPKAPKAITKTAKDIANENGEPYISIVSIELEEGNIGNGAFELDWNDKFIIQLVRAGYQSKANEPEDVIVDRWFQTVCRNVAMENYEQWEANQTPEDRIRSIDKRDIGGGRSEVS